MKIRDLIARFQELDSNAELECFVFNDDFYYPTYNRITKVERVELTKTNLDKYVKQDELTQADFEYHNIVLNNDIKFLSILVGEEGDR